MIKVLFESSIFLHQKVGGVSKYVIKLNKNLSKKNISSKIISPLTINYFLNLEKKNVFYLVKINKIPVFCRKLFFFINNLFLFIYLKIYRPDIIHFSYYNKSLIKFLSIPYVVTIYDLIHEKMKFNQIEFHKKELLNNARHIICISKQTKKDLIRIYKIDKKKISVIYLGADKNNIYKKKKDNFILYVGNRNRYKNFQNFIKAYSVSRYLTKKYKIICFGGGSFNNIEINTFKKLGIKKNIIYKKGSDLELKNLYKKASLHVSLSTYEGFGLTLLEAMQFKCPVVCSNIPVFREVYNNSCIFVDPRNINTIKKGIEKVLKSNRIKKKIISNGSLLAKKFSWEKCASETSLVYKNIVNR